MNPFKKGDKVRFIDNELNRAETYFMEYEFIVDKVTNKPLCFLKFDDETGYNYPHPVSPLRLELAKPPAKFAGVQVGQHIRVLSKKAGVVDFVAPVKEMNGKEFSLMSLNNILWFDLNGNCVYGGNFVYADSIVPPSEGSREWAIEMMRDGNTIIGHIDFNKYTMRNGIIYESNNLIESAYTIQQFKNDKMDFGWHIYTPAKFANVKVGDWVEIETTDGQTKQHQVTHVTNGHSMFSIDNDVYFLTKNGGMVHMSNNAKAIRIVPPEEVEVEITLKGTVRWLDKNFETISISSEDNYFADMSINQLSPDQAERVKAILKAQEKAE